MSGQSSQGNGIATAEITPPSTDISALGISQEELFAPVDSSDEECEIITAPRYSYWKSVWRVFFKRKINVVFLALLGFVVVFSFVYPLLIGYDERAIYANVTDTSAWHLTPAQAIARYGFDLHWILGTGAKGEATFDYIWYGSTVSIGLAFICAAVNMLVGVILGTLWGLSKRLDYLMTEVHNVIGNLPYVLIVSVPMLVLSPGFWSLVFALTVTGWLGIAYFIRTQVIMMRDRTYNLASRCLGTPPMRIAFKNILPYLSGVIVTLMAVEIPAYISMEVFLSYIGMGVGKTSLGTIIQAAQAFMRTPGRQIEFWAPVSISAFITVVLYVVGQNLGDAADPRTHI